MALIEAYFDESGSHEGSPILCLAGVAFERDQAIRFSREWRAVLDKYKLPYFRMSQCAHRQGPFKSLKRGQTINCEKAMIKILKKRSLYSFGSMINEDEFYQTFPDTKFFGRAYSFLSRSCLVSVRDWAEKNNFDGKIAYFFEAGHRDQGQANSIMNRIFRVPRLREHYKYTSHTFADKIQFLPLQAADLVAWQWFTAAKRKRAGIPGSRKDFRALIRDGDSYTDWTEGNLRVAAEEMGDFDKLLP